MHTQVHLINRGSEIVGVIGAYRVIAEPCNVTLITTIEENRSTWHPEGAVDEVPLGERPAISKVEMVQLMRTKGGFNNVAQCVKTRQHTATTFWVKCLVS